MTTENINLPEGLRKILRAYLSLDLKSTSDVAKEIGISRSTLTFALDGKRSMSEESLDKLMDYFGLIEYLPDASFAHYLKVGSDIEPLQTIVNSITISELFYIKPFGHVDLDESFTGFFIFRYQDFHGGDGLLLVHRDKMRSGKGVVSIKPELAKPITPEAFAKVSWAKVPEIVLPDDVIRKLEAPFYAKASPIPLGEIKSLLNVQSETNWLDVRKAAEAADMSAEDVLKLIQARGQ